MQPFDFHTGVAAPLRVSDVDTDQIIPARYCAGVTKDGLAQTLFADWRDSDPDFVLNRPPYNTASVLVAGENFGSGSSREWAVWALQAFGIRAIVAPQFGDIFRGNALKNGLLVVELPATVINKLWDVIDGDPGMAVTVDLVHRVVHFADAECPFEIDDDTRWRLINGLDDIGLSLEHLPSIERYEKRRRQTLPTTASHSAKGA